MSHITCHVSSVTCHMSCVKCHMSQVTADMYHVTCHMSHVPFFNIFFLRKGLSKPVEGLLSTGPTPSSFNAKRLVILQLEKSS